MFKGKSLPVGTLFMVLVIMLALLGVGYALWSDTLVIEGQVQTGEVDMAFSPCGTNDSGTANDPGYDKHVASCECARSTGSIEDPSDDGYDQLNITITKGYPSYSCNVTYDMTNIGTVPVHLYSVLAEYEPEELDVEQVCEVWDEVLLDYVPVDIGYQLHPNESVDCSIDLHVRQEAAENDTLTLHKEYWWGQYNELLLVVSGNTLNFSSTGWGGWSCPSTHPNVVAGGVSKTNTQPWVPADYPYSQVLAVPGATLDSYTYPDFPHWCYSDDPGECTHHSPASRDETGIAVHNGGTGQNLYVYVYCIP
jgi:predicted ribosomally synthesized peptide with SipW-like signal peptide